MTAVFKNQQEKRLFLNLQQGIDISEKPLSGIEQRLGLSEKEILEVYSDFKKRGLIRRFGAVFEPSKMGYKSLLCAAKSDNPEKIKVQVKDIKEITHCYTRDYEYNIWFTFTAEKDKFKYKLQGLRTLFDSDILELPAVKKFKTQVIFNLGLTESPGFFIPAADGDIIFQKSDIDLALSFFDVELSALSFSPEEIERVRHWKSCGALKRFALVPYHREIGYKANVMCIWHLNKSEIETAGAELRKRPDITHCYERTPVDGKFPYNFFAMMHSESFEKLHAEVMQINKNLNLPKGRLLTTLSEIKKTSFYP